MQRHCARGFHVRFKMVGVLHWFVRDVRVVRVVRGRWVVVYTYLRFGVMYLNPLNRLCLVALALRFGRVTLSESLQLELICNDDD